MERRIGVAFTLRGVSDGIVLVARDEDGVEVQHTLACHPEAAREADAAVATIRRQLAKTGETIYACSEVAVEASPIPFLPVSALNALRRDTLERLTVKRERCRPRVTGGVFKNDAPYPEKELTYLSNVLNQKAQAFYRRHGVTAIEPAAESGLDMRGRKVMTTRYCIKQQFGICPQAGGAEPIAEPLYLVDDEGHRLRLDFDCQRCEIRYLLGVKSGRDLP
jgi:putative protease